MATSVASFKISPARLRSWFYRVPLCTRAFVFIIVAFWVGSLIFSRLPRLAVLLPTDVSIWSMHRLNTYPFLHTGFFHTVFALIALVPLLERFEVEHGTLVTLALFVGPFSTAPGIVYIFIDHIIFRANGPVQGASVWIFLLLACEAVKTYRANPSFSLGPYKLPTYFFLADCCGCAVGYAFEFGYLKILIPPEWVLRAIESRLNLLGRLPHYVSVDHKTFGRYGVLPSTDSSESHVVSPSVLGLNPRNFAPGSPPASAV